MVQAEPAAAISARQNGSVISLSAPKMVKLAFQIKPEYFFYIREMDSVMADFDSTVFLQAVIHIRELASRKLRGADASGEEP